MTILVLSQQHTGTWATVDYLLRHREVDGFQQLWRFGQDGGCVRVGIGRRIREFIGENTLVHAHIDVASDRYAPLLVHHFPVVVPLRDPLASLVSKHGREPKAWPHEGFLENWWYCAQMVDRGTGHVVTVDMEPDWPGVSRHCGLEPVEPPGIVNAGPKTRLKRAYENGDAASLERALGVTWSDLRGMEPSLRPVLERHGYSALLWWS